VIETCIKNDDMYLVGILKWCLNSVIVVWGNNSSLLYESDERYEIHCVKRLKSL